MTAMKARELGRRQRGGRRPGRARRRHSGEAGHPGPDRPHRARTTVLRRTADDTDPVERVIVANADQLSIVTALADPEPRPRLIDRCLVAAYDAGLDAAALPDQVRSRRPGRAPRAYAPLDIPYVVAGRADETPARRRSARRSPAGSRASSATPASASPPWSTRWCRGGPGRARQRRSPAGAATRPRRRWRCRCPAAGWVIDTPGVRSLRAGARGPGQGGASLPRPGPGDRGLPARLHPPGCRTARWTTGSRRGQPGWPGSTRCAACCAAAKATTPLPPTPRTTPQNHQPLKPHPHRTPVRDQPIDVAITTPIS